MSEFDEQCERQEHGKNIRYFRYVDDILIFCFDGNAEAVWRDVHNALNDKLNLEIHCRDHEKTQLLPIRNNVIYYLGYALRIENEKIVVGVREKSIANICQSIVNIFTAYRYWKMENRLELLRWRLNLRITGCRFHKKRYGWLHYYDQVTDWKAIEKLDKFVQHMAKRFEVPDTKFEKFLHLAHEVKKKKSPNIPDFDKYDLSQKTELLSRVFSVNMKGKTPEQIDKEFGDKIFWHIKQLERDMHTDGESG